ncbi:MAG: hypothetical protein ACD_75C00147G0002 [uncultured bacterium]|nr:MAG: hypothetical protein ACD_75C00147G0002 [uncultured bacterium]
MHDQLATHHHRIPDRIDGPCGVIDRLIVKGPNNVAKGVDIGNFLEDIPLGNAFLFHFRQQHQIDTGPYRLVRTVHGHQFVETRVAYFGGTGNRLCRAGLLTQLAPGQNLEQGFFACLGQANNADFHGISFTLWGEKITPAGTV